MAFKLNLKCNFLFCVPILFPSILYITITQTHKSHYFFQCDLKLLSK